jgi:hypothetical protein
MSASRSPTILPADVPIEEERIPGYDPKRFLPVNPGDLLNNRYKIVVKVGWGTTSTVWLAQDTQRYVLALLDSYSYIVGSPRTRGTARNERDMQVAS